MKRNKKKAWNYQIPKYIRKVQESAQFGIATGMEIKERIKRLETNQQRGIKMKKK